ncbi:hypothetical protein CASFOL_015979 [Castilleja foliolosa]|uniref:Uncharacterized protein n=1 Tax=Castilleja foliolosa TaxID=1961234 RepID=A0ABD3DHB5_9LAMI
MRGFSVFFGFNLLLVVSCLREANAAKLTESDNRVYIVYMGAPRNDQAHLLSLLKKMKRNSVLETYNKGLSGFAARLSDEQAKSIAKSPGVVSVFPDPVLQLHTTHSWDFLKYQTAVKIDSQPSSPSDSASTEVDTIIGILDTGIWPESKSFVDDDMGPVPSHWKGVCMAGDNFTSSTCNKKLIGARYYDDGSDSGTPRDDVGHGTHVASTAAGRPVSGASYYDLANGTAVGGSPGSRIAMYRVCTADGGCLGSAILKAFDDAIADGVDVLSLSLGSFPGKPVFDTDPIAIGAFHAAEKGIIVVCSAGNSGPSSKTVVNVAPWILTVAATTIDRDFEADIMLAGNKTIIKGGGINFSALNKSAVYPIVDGSSSGCSLDDDKVNGKIVICDFGNIFYTTTEKFNMLKSQGAIGLIVIDDDQRQVPSNFGTSPIAVVSEEDGAKILSYINSTSNPMATILPTVVTINYKPAPVVAYFSSRGPTFGIKNLLKPDIAAPGVAILAAWPSNDKGEAIPGKEPPLFDILSGTSMSCPHVSGLAAIVKSQHPKWSPSAIRSAIMTTAIQTNNLHTEITTNTGSIATPYDIGAGEISLSGPLQPGLVYETENIEYIQFLCDMGYNTSVVKSIASIVPNNFSCPSTPNPDLISDMNYPSIAVLGLKVNDSRTVNRTVTNVGEMDVTYTATVEAPASVQVEVVPKKLQFTNNATKLSFQVTLKLIASSNEDLFGSILWSNEKYKVRSPFVVSII